MITNKLNIPVTVGHDGIRYFKEKLKRETNIWVQWRIEKQIEILEDAILYHESRLAKCQ